jgi:hypothetical protein
MQVLQWLHITLQKSPDLLPQGMRVICVLTKADMVDDSVFKDTAELENSLTVHQMRQCVMQKAGLPLNQVLSVALTAALPQRRIGRAIRMVSRTVFFYISLVLAPGHCLTSIRIRGDR